MSLLSADLLHLPTEQVQQVIAVSRLKMHHKMKRLMATGYGVLAQAGFGPTGQTASQWHRNIGIAMTPTPAKFRTRPLLPPQCGARACIPI